jgi:diguanylate cyclase (GGDEF)-like protein/PAS domain S-box-containing protein
MPLSHWPWQCRTKLQHRLLAIVLLCMLALTLADSLGTWNARQGTIAYAQEETTNLARSLADDVAGDFGTLDTILIGLRERVQHDGTADDALDRLRALIRTRVAALPMLHSLLVLDSKGRLLASGDDVLPRGKSFANSPVFLHHRDSPSLDMFVGPPVHNILDGRWVIKLSRRVNHADGSFAGIVVACIATDFFQARFAAFDIGREGHIGLVNRDGIGVARNPPRPGFIGSDISHGPLFTTVQRSGSDGTLEATSPQDGTRRLASFREVPGAPLILSVSRSKSEVLAGWRETALFHALGLLIVLVLIYELGRRLATLIADGERARELLEQAVGQSAKSERRLSRANERLAMAEQIAHIGHWEVDLTNGRTLTWSDEVYRIHGLDPAVFVPDLASAIKAYHPDDRQAVTAAVENTLATGQPFLFDQRVVRQDGEIRHVRSRGIRQDDAAGQPCKLFGVIEDITEQKLVEDRLRSARQAAEAANTALARANGALETMAMQDALTGLANRRHFDSSLNTAFADAAGSSGALSLIIIDIDRFKQYNDLYGHPAGDACLRLVSQAIAGVAGRSGELVCRYGGEEIAVLLPHCTEARAVIVAKRAAQAVRALGIRHAGSEHGVVTISAGVAALGAGQPMTQPTDFVKQADIALYAAKAAGRDCVLSGSAGGRAKPPVLRLVEPAPDLEPCVG